MNEYFEVSLIVVSPNWQNLSANRLSHININGHMNLT